MIALLADTAKAPAEVWPIVVLGVVVVAWGAFLKWRGWME